MCPACMATVALLVGSAVSSGGVAALVVSKLRGKGTGQRPSGEDESNEGNGGEATETDGSNRNQESKKEDRVMNQSAIEHPKVVTQTEWIAARKELLAKEKSLTRQRDALAEERRKLPWVKVEKNYVFETPGGKKTLAELFGGASQMAIYHFMLGPDWEQGCPSCSLLADHFDNLGIHLAQRDVKLTIVSRAPLSKIETFKKRMGWKFPWASSLGSEFNFDFGVSVTKEDAAKEQIYNYAPTKFPSEERPGMSIFYKNAKGEVFHTYSVYARGLEDFMSIYAILDRVPKGRDEAGLPHGMAWVRHHDRYPESNVAEVKAAKT